MPPLKRTQNLLTAQRNEVFAAVQRIYDASKVLQADEIYLFKPRYDKLASLEAEFATIQKEIMESNAGLEEGDKQLEVSKIRVTFDELITATQMQYLTIARSVTPPPSVTPLTPVAPAVISLSNSLPTIKLPTFSGEVAEWPNFQALFHSLIDQCTTITAVQKFHYLRASLKDSALSTISNFQISSENYPLAYKALTDRYANKRLLASLYIQQLLDFTPIKSSNYQSLQLFLTTHRNSINALRALEIDNLEDFILLSLCLSNLDSYTRKQFETKRSSHTTPTYQQLIHFIEENSRTLELCGLDHAKSKPTNLSTNTSPPRPRLNSLFAANTVSDNNARTQARSPTGSYAHLSCPLCRQIHALHACDKFSRQSLTEKYATLNSLRRCRNCLGAHAQRDCKSLGSCRTCGSRKHHTSIHPESTQRTPVASAAPTQQAPVANAAPAEQPAAKSLACQLKTSSFVARTALLGTVRALIQDDAGHLQPFRAVVDSGSQISAITRSLATRLGLKLHPSSQELTGIGQTSTQVHGTVHCTLVSRLDKEHTLGVQALVLSAISSTLPTSSVPLEIFEKYRDLSLADDKFHVPDQIDFLIGADLYPDILNRTGDTVVGTSPSALNTVFGWVILGPICVPDNQSVASDHVSNSALSFLTCTTPLDRTLRLFWESEEVSRPPHKDPEEQRCEDHFVSTHTRDAAGRYSVSLPFKSECVPLGSNRNSALQNYLSLERRLKRTPEHDDAYQHFMHDYVDSQHMQPAAHPTDYVIPHHCVHKVTSSSTKLRVVFNASSPDRNGVTLNQNLLSGPKLQSDLPSILTTFRTHAIAICADIRQMYRQILVDQRDRAHQHIFWRPNADSPVVEYELNTVTYGLVPSAFLAQRVLHQLVEDEGKSFPLASQAIDQHTYIDDIVSGACDLDQARKLQHELQYLLARGGFDLRKWASNDANALTALPAEHLETPLVFSTEEQGIKILGLLWDPKSDNFSFHTQRFEGVLTKRSALSYIARIFDPLGFLAPFVVWMKMFMQQLWSAQLLWDDPLPEPMAQQWLSAVANVSDLSRFRIPRAFLDKCDSCHLVGFCDASERGYSAVLYLHARARSSAYTTLLRARSKVAPLKPLTIPKLELSSALLLSRLVQTTLPSISTLNLNSVTLYTDSMIVLAWLATPPHRLKTFVANRVVEVLESSAPTDWAHVPSEDNPADCASRGITPVELMNHPLWLTGPSFLNAPVDTWPRSGVSVNATLELPEFKSISVSLAIHAEVDPLFEKLETFSTLLRAQRVFGHVVRFTRILTAKRKNAPPPTGPLEPSELQQALNLLIKVTQQHYYYAEMQQIRQHRELTSGLASLRPFIDEAGLFKAAGRLRESLLPDEAKFPVLLPKQAHLSALICDHFHKISLHSGPRTVQALIQQRFWIVSLRGLLRQRIRQCLTCHKFRSKPLQPRMSDLPSPRVQLTRAFTHVGLDFAGPLCVRSSNRRKAPVSKGYLCIYVCMATKAVHLEMVSDLTTEAFIASLDRFLSRRGLPSHIYSDRGRNFVGAARQLREVRDAIAKAEPNIHDSLASRSVHWVFNPPYAPNFGGLWEAGVKSVKSLLRRLIGDVPQTHEEYATLFSRIEAVLNSRPLCANSADPSEGGDYLTPGHFLIGAPLLSPPEIIFPETASRLSRWERVRQMHQTFWTRWSTEYLHTQMQRGKWTRGSPDLKVGDVVFVLEASSTPLSWPIGRVQDVHPGRDGVVRVVTLRTAAGTYTRPVNKLVTLPQA